MAAADIEADGVDVAAEAVVSAAVAACAITATNPVIFRGSVLKAAEVVAVAVAVVVDSVVGVGVVAAEEVAFVTTAKDLAIWLATALRNA